MVTLAWPIASVIAFALTLAAIRVLAKVCLPAPDRQSQNSARIGRQQEPTPLIASAKVRRKDCARPPTMTVDPAPGA